MIRSQRRRLAWPFFVILAWGCSEVAVPDVPDLPDARVPDIPDPRKTIGKLIDIPRRQIPNLVETALPKAQNGLPQLIEVAGAEIDYDPTVKDAITAFAGCVDILMGCIEPGQRSLDDCFFSAPKCSTNEPWNESEDCCATACFQEYAVARNGGLGEFQSLEAVMFVNKSCSPGLVERLAEGR